MKGPVVITGAARGIGLETARLVAEAGASVALVDRDAEPLEVAADRLRAAGADVVRHVADVADEQAVAAVFESVRERMGPVTGAVACAGIDRGAALHELAASTWDEVVAVNLRGVFLTCRAALNHMLEAGGGSLVCVSSPLAFVGVPGGTGAYSATKGGVSALVRTLAVDYGSQGIRVNALLPGATETDLMWAGQPADAVASLRETVNEQIPLGRLADPDEPARAAFWLLSDASSYVTGSQLACDGGVLAKASISI